MMKNFETILRLCLSQALVFCSIFLSFFSFFFFWGGEVGGGSKRDYVIQNNANISRKRLEG